MKKYSVVKSTYIDLPGNGPVLFSSNSPCLIKLYCILWLYFHKPEHPTGDFLRLVIRDNDRFFKYSHFYESGRFSQIYFDYRPFCYTRGYWPIRYAKIREIKDMHIDI